MDAGLTAHVNQLQCLPRHGQRSFQNILRFPQKRKDTPVMITVSAVVNKVNIGKSLQHTGNGFNFLRIASFAEVRHAFDNFHGYT